MTAYWEGLAEKIAAVDPSSFAGALPFPYAVVDGFVSDDEVAALSSEFPDPSDPRWKTYSDAPEQGKQELSAWEDLGHSARLYLSEMMDVRVRDALTSATGIPSLKADLWGGGYHQSGTGAHLDLHCDFSHHPVNGWRRRLNVLLFVNSGWDEAWGGDLELWPTESPDGAVKLAPVGGRLVLFETGAYTPHGHPVPLSCPEGVTRKSIAVYYYSEVGVEEVSQRSTVWMS